MHVCLIGASHPCHNPRLIREADSLAEQGVEVRVIAPSHMPLLHQEDKLLIARRAWRLETVNVRPEGVLGKLRAYSIRGRRRVMQRVFRNTRWAEHGYSLALRELKWLAMRWQADWFIAHTQAALPAAAAATRRWNARLGFDCEDVLTEHPDNPRDIVRQIEQAYLPRCDYVSVPSHVIAERLAAEYGIQSPLVLYNVFPLKLAAGLKPPAMRPRHSKLRLHWFGQVIGPGRGIEEAIRAVGILGNAVELHLRGHISPSFQENLMRLARESDAGDRVFFYDQVPHDDLIGTLDEFDVGLALEQSNYSHYALTVTNKLFSYMLGGLAVIATDTPGQREVLAELPGVGFLYPAVNVERLTSCIRVWIENPVCLRVAQQAAWEVARTRYCWDIEQTQFLSAVSSSHTSK